MATIPDLLVEAAGRYDSRPALAIRRGLRTETWTYQELLVASRAAAERVRAGGAGPGDRVLAMAPNCPELVIGMLGVWLAGGVLVPIDLRTPADVIERIVEQTQPKLTLGLGPIEGAERVPLLRLSAEALTPTLSQGERGPVPPLPLGEGWGEGFSRDLQPEEQECPPPAAPNLAEIVFTSGTTAAPKGVMLIHANILANVRAARETLPIRVGERLLSLLPLSHMMEQTAGLLTALASGATVYYATSRRSSALMAALQRHRIGLLICVPEVLKLMLAGIEREVERTGRRHQWDTLLAVAGRLPIAARPLLFGPVHRRLGGRLRLVLCGGAALDPELWRTWERLGVRVIQGYGATECAPIVASNRMDRRLAGSVGWPVDGVEARLAPDGEVLVRGPNVTPGYWQDEGATAAAFEDGWYRSGDLGRLGRDGELYLLGRKKEMIVLADGRNVFPQDVEDILKRDPAIRDCTVVGKVRPGGGEEVHAVVIPAGDPEESRAAVRRANARLGPQQQVGGVTIWTEPDFPRTPSLKVKRREVLAEIAPPGSAPILGAAARSAADHRSPDVAGPSGPSSMARLRPAAPRIGAVPELLARVSGRPADQIEPESDLSLDLGLDSLARVELAVLLEEELGRSLPDEVVAALRTVAELEAALERGDGGAQHAVPLPAWPRTRPAVLLRGLLQELALFPLLRLVCRPRRVESSAYLRSLDGPCLLIANHSSHLDSVAALSLLPRALRRRTAVAAAADYFFATRPLACFSSLALGAFPFHRQGAVSASLAHCGDLADDGYSILIFPEGTRSPDGRLAPFKAGIGLLARELGVPVVPIHLDGLHAILPKGRTRPRPGRFHARVGRPIEIDRSLTSAEAAEMLEARLRELVDAVDVPHGPGHTPHRIMMR